MWEGLWARKLGWRRRCGRLSPGSTMFFTAPFPHPHFLSSLPLFLPFLQVFTAVLMHYTRDQLPFSMFADSKVPNDTWGKNNGERGQQENPVWFAPAAGEHLPWLVLCWWLVGKPASGAVAGLRTNQLARMQPLTCCCPACCLLLLVCPPQGRATCTSGATASSRAAWTRPALASTACCTSST